MAIAHRSQKHNSVLHKDRVTIIMVASEDYTSFPKAIDRLYEHTDYPFDLIVVEGQAPHAVQMALEKRVKLYKNMRILYTHHAPLLSEAYTYAAENLEALPHVSVTAIQGNFHDIPRYGALLYRPEHSYRKRLLTMLGFTFGNLDNELRWVADTLSPFHKGDLFLFDVQRSQVASVDPKVIRKHDPALQPGALHQRQREIEAFIMGPLKRYRQGGATNAELHNELGAACVVPGSYQIEQVAYLQEDSATRRFVLAKARRYSIPELAQAMADLGWHMVEHAPSGDDKRAPISQLLFERR